MYASTTKCATSLAKDVAEQIAYFSLIAHESSNCPVRWGIMFSGYAEPRKHDMSQNELLVLLLFAEMGVGQFLALHTMHWAKPYS